MTTTLPSPAADLSAMIIGDFQVDPAANELRDGSGKVQRIEPRVMALLMRLAQVPGTVVSRETLINEVWSRRMVNDEVLSRAVADLRIALGDDSRTPRYIETIPKSGYRLIAEVRNPEAVQAKVNGTATRLGLPLGRYAVAAAGLMALGLLTIAVIAFRKPPPIPATPDILQMALQQAQPITAEQGVEIGPRLSPSGRQLLYTQISDGKATLTLLDLETRSRQAVKASGQAAQGVFLPDSKGFVFRQIDAGQCSLQLIDAEGVPRKVGDCEVDAPARMDVSPDGRTLVFSRLHRLSLPAGLVLLDLQSGVVRNLTEPGPDVGEDSMPRFSPDGKRIAFVRGNSSARTVLLIAVGGGEPRRVSPLTGLTYGLTWMPDGRSLVVAADWFGFRALNWLDVQSGEGRLLGARGARSPDATQDKIVFELALYQANLHRIAPGAAVATAPVHASTRYTSQAVYSPDGSQLAFVSNREGNEAIYLAPEGQPARRVQLPDSHRYMRPTFSADGKSLYALRMNLGADKSAPQQAVRIALSGGAAEVLPLGDEVAWVQESRDGQWLYYGERQDRQMRLWRAPLPRLIPAERLPVPLAGDVQLNRSHLAFTQSGLQGLTLCALDGKSCQAVAVPSGSSHDNHWALTDGGIYFVDPESRPRQLLRRDLKSGVTRAVTTVLPTTLGAGLAVHPGERELIVAREEAPNIDLLLTRWKALR